MKPSFHFFVQDVIPIAPQVRLFQFDYGLTPMEYYPGQFCVATLPRSEPPQTAALTIATSPLRRQSFELAVVRTGNFGTRFYDSVNVGDVVPMSVPQGKFTLELTDPRPALLIAYDYCTTGVRAIWQYHADSGQTRRLTFLHAQRPGQSALFSQEFTTSTSPVRQYLPVRLNQTSETLPPATLQAALSSLPNCLVYLVGEGPDVKATQTALEQSGLERDRLKVERWS